MQNDVHTQFGEFGLGGYENGSMHVIKADGHHELPKRQMADM